MSINTTNKDTSKENTNNAKNLFEEHFIPNRKHVRTYPNDYNTHKHTSIIIDELTVNGCVFIVKYDRLNNHMLTIINMVEDGCYETIDENTGKKIFGVLATVIRLEDVPIAIEDCKKYSRETREIMKHYYKKYHRDILKRL